MKRTTYEFIFLFLVCFSFVVLLTSCSRTTVFERNDATYSIDARVMHCWTPSEGYYKVKLDSDEGMGVLRSIAARELRR